MELIDAAAAAERLGIKQATLYAYVSRGVLRRRHGEDGRRSLFDAAEVEELARKGRPRRPPGASELVIESRITRLGADRPYYRGRDAIELAREESFETVAEWLWGGLPPLPGEPGQPDAWASDPDGVAAARRALPGGLSPLENLQVITTVLGATDTLRFHLDPASVAATGARLISGLVDALPQAAPATPAGGTVAERLWSRLCPAEPEPALLKALETALVLLADHELAASTLAARVAASAKADPYAVVLTGLGVLSGPLHGGASYGAERLLNEIQDPAQASRLIADRLRRGERIPGYGHTVYKHGDARGEALLALVEAAAPGHPRVEAALAVRKETVRRRLPAANIDFALAALTTVAGMIPAAGEAIFAVARTAGWLAHAMEEYGRRTLLRPRAVYTGP
ncbi:citrate/2-methylcitrate synthase [Nonomuraea sp. NPDC050310]|uniref:citrate/2-methylcitrate synthase n=1 Tax=Nonomuraea sp. NPDC050310 TaxID=3154935 RepID=UPI0033E74F9D